jgi:hypothetical protein
MIELGERAMNIRFDRKSELARAASGSLNIAQAVCYNICVNEHILETVDETTDVRCNVDRATEEVMKQLALKFHSTIKAFAAQGATDDRACIHILEHLAQSRDGYLSVQYMLFLPKNVRRRTQEALAQTR